jgi:hypothetical protein
MASVQQAEQALGRVEEAIAAGTIIPSESWYSRFADVRLVAGERPVGFTPSAGSREVITPHAALLSALFVQLRDAFDGLLDHVNKLEFYARLAHVANDWHSRTKIGTDPADLLRWVLQEARVILREIEQGEFDGLLIAPGDMVVADVLRRLERGESLGADEMAIYEAHIRSRGN